jgi:hypothetical protein
MAKERESYPLEDRECETCKHWAINEHYHPCKGCLPPNRQEHWEPNNLYLDYRLHKTEAGRRGTLVMVLLVFIGMLLALTLTQAQQITVQQQIIELRGELVAQLVEYNHDLQEAVETIKKELGVTW